MWLYFWPSDHFVERGSPPFPAVRTHIRWRLACVIRSWNEPGAVLWVTSPYVVSPGWAYLSDLLAYPHANANSFTWLGNHWQRWEMFKPQKGGLQMWRGHVSMATIENPPIPAGSQQSMANVFGKWFCHLLHLEMDSQRPLCSLHNCHIKVL